MLVITRASVTIFLLTGIGFAGTGGKICEREDEISPSVTRRLPPRHEPHSAQMEVLDLDLVERAGSDDVEAAVSDDVEGIG